MGKKPYYITTPKAYVDNIVDWVKDMWKTMDISYDKSIRTTDKEPIDEENIRRCRCLVGIIYNR